ncbi:MAG: glycine cleavage T C-terminal barrel domain-containing protein [Phycisphaeraceae bacterium]
MAYPTPLLSQLEQDDAQMMGFGEHIAIAAVHESVEVEYGALRKKAAIMDCPHRGLIELRGADRTDFLHRLLTHDVRGMKPGQTQRQFMLTAKGRIMADLLVRQEADRTLIETDSTDAASIVAELEKMLFGEDVRITDMTQTHHGFAVHGPKAHEVIAQLGLNDAIRIEQDVCGASGIPGGAGIPGVSGVGVWVEREAAGGVWTRARESGVMPLGWLAFNMARIEGGMVLFHVDFGPDSLPHETGRVKAFCSFTKGCYRGQEIVARMESLGHPSKILVGFTGRTDALPVSGAEVLDNRPPDGKVVGVVTSSTLSPLRSAKPIGFVMVKWGRHAADTELFTAAEGSTVAITIQALKVG